MKTPSVNLESKPEHGPSARAGELRPLRAEDLPRAMELSILAGWNQTVEDWRLLLDLDPESCFAIEADGRLAATAALACYGTRLAWVGMVLTHPEYRRRGYARQLFTAVLGRADALGIATVKLDATDQGAPLYRSFGFREEQPVERWSRAGTAAQPADRGMPPGETWESADASIFGADRAPLLRLLAARGSASRSSEGYLLARPGRTGSYLGPCVARSARAARDLIESRLRDQPDTWTWDLLPRNEEAVRMAAALGFSPKRTLVRMARGQQLKEQTEHIYAIAGLELG